jgi:hypothetical protein
VVSKSIGLYISGLVSQKEAERELEEAENWFRTVWNEKSFNVTKSIAQGPYGWKMEFNAVEETEVN